MPADESRTAEPGWLEDEGRHARAEFEKRIRLDFGARGAAALDAGGSVRDILKRLTSTEAARV